MLYLFFKYIKSLSTVVSAKPKPKPKPEVSVPKKENDKVKKEKKTKHPVPVNFQVCIIYTNLFWWLDRVPGFDSICMRRAWLCPGFCSFHKIATSVTWLFDINNNCNVNVGRNKLDVDNIFEHFIFECTFIVTSYITYTFLPS